MCELLQRVFYTVRVCRSRVDVRTKVITQRGRGLLL